MEILRVILNTCREVSHDRVDVSGDVKPVKDFYECVVHTALVRMARNGPVVGHH